ncbi:MAG: hypothetical protein IPJ13_23730 [Saprospiraceae bacterium]|nr:hypothetical protein [Saprospiraceae bacterium]
MSNIVFLCHELRGDHSAKDAAIAQKDVEIQQQAARIEDLAHLIAQLQKIIFGPKTERFIPTGRSQTTQHIWRTCWRKPRCRSAQEQNQSSKLAKGRVNNRAVLLASCTHLPVEIRNVPVEHDESDIHLRDEISDRLAKRPHVIYHQIYPPRLQKSRFRYHRHRTGHRRTYRQVKQM